MQNNQFCLFPPRSRQRNNGPSLIAYICALKRNCRNFIFIGDSYYRAFWKTSGEGYTPKKIHKITSEYFNCCTCNNKLITYDRLNKYKTILKYENIDSVKALWMYFLGRRGWNKSGLISVKLLIIEKCSCVVWLHPILEFFPTSIRSGPLFTPKVWGGGAENYWNKFFTEP